MSDEKSLPDGELLPPRELMSLIDPTSGGAGLPGTSNLLGATGVTPDPTTTDPTAATGAPDATQAAAPTHGLTDDALQQAQTAPGTSDSHVESTATS